jgi:hypothetical protein
MMGLPAQAFPDHAAERFEIVPRGPFSFARAQKIVRETP